MTRIFTPDCPNGFEEVTLDNKDDLEKKVEADRNIERRINELIQRVADFERKLIDEEVEKHLKKFEQDGLVSRNEKGEYYPTDY